MAKGEASVCVYLPKELLAALDSEVYKTTGSRSNYIRDLILNHLSHGNDKLRLELLGRGEK